MVRGFQSLLEPISIDIDGYTCITGDSNQGKSALIRALKALVTNKVGDSFINNKSSECQVAIETETDIVLWEKSKSSSRYTINSEEYTKLGRNTPEALARLGIFEIKTQDKGKHWPQIHSQNDSNFIISEQSPTVTSELVGASQETIVLMKATKLAKDDQSTLKGEISLLESQLSSVKDIKALIDPFETLLKVRGDLIDQLEILIEALSQKVLKFKELLHSYELGKLTLDVFNDLREVSPNPPSSKFLADLTELTTSYKFSKKVSQIEVPETVPSFDDRKKDRISRLTSIKIGFDTSTEVITTLQTIPEALFTDPQRKLDNLVSISRMYDRVVNTQSRIDLLKIPSTVPNPPQLDKIRQMSRLKEEFQFSAKEISSIDDEENDLLLQLEEIRIQIQEILNVLKTIDYCTYCGSTLKQGSLLTHYGEHQ
jgi:energy-coupling factor transporter ATP-binding protein EcfA2